MATTVTALSGQSMQDIIIQSAGSLNAWYHFCRDNDVALSDVPVAGVAYVVSDAALAAGNAAELTRITREGMVLATLAGRGLTLLSEDGDTLVSEDDEVIITETEI